MCENSGVLSSINIQPMIESDPQPILSALSKTAAAVINTAVNAATPATEPPLSPSPPPEPEAEAELVAARNQSPISSAVRFASLYSR